MNIPYLGNHCSKCGKWLWHWHAKIRYTFGKGEKTLGGTGWVHATCGFKMMDSDTKKEFIEQFRKEISKNEV